MRVQATLSFAMTVAPDEATQVPILLKTMRVWRLSKVQFPARLLLPAEFSGKVLSSQSAYESEASAPNLYTVDVVLIS